MRTIRLATPSDARSVLEIYGPFVADTVVSFETEVPSEAEMGQRIASTLGHAPWLVCVEGAMVVGYAYASKHRERAAYQWSSDVSVYVRDGHRRGGVGRSLYTALFALLRRQGFRAAHAGITLPNAASVGLHESLGFEPVGVYRRVGFKLGDWHDVGTWQLELAARRGAPAPLRSLEDLSSASEVAGVLATVAA